MSSRWVVQTVAWTRRRRALAWAGAYVVMSCGSPTAADGGPGLAVASVSVDPANSTVVVGASQPLQASVRDADGNPLSGAAVVWTVRDANIATVTDGGVVTGRAVGNTQVAANVAGRSGLATITVTPVPVANVTVSPSPLALIIGQSSGLAVVMADARGVALAGRAVSWSTDNASVATVSATGVVSAVAVGTATITATSDGVSGTTTVTVTPVPVASVVISPATATVAVAQTATLNVVLKDASGSVLTGRAVSWTSSDDAVARVSTTGTVTAVAPGQATIKATSEGIAGTALVTVTAVPVRSVVVKPGSASLVVGATTTLTATPQDASGAPLANRVVVWTTNDVSVATVTAAGVVTAVGAGTATITALCEGQTGTATVTVAAVPAASVTVEPATPTVLVGQNAPLTATVKDAGGNILVGRTVTWLSTNTLVAVVTPGGIVTGVAAGSATISATVDGKSGSATVTVTVVPVASVAVQPKTPSLVVGGTVALAAVVTDANGVVTSRVVTWTTNNSAVATVSATGVVTAVSPGSANITAESEGKSDAAVATVTRAPVASVAVQPTASALVVGQTVALTATVIDTRGVAVTDRLVTWASSNDAVASVSATGLVTALAPGAATITAASEGKSGSAVVGVSTVPVGSVSVQPPTVSLFVAQTSVLTATVKDANGMVVNDRPLTWSSGNTGVATVSSTGVVTAVAPGSTTITASAGGKSGSSSVIVTLVPVGSVTVAPGTATIITGQVTQLTTTIRDANGVVVTGRAVTWTTSDAAVATVSSGGVVTAVAPGDATITATSEGRSGNASITVIPVPVGSVAVAPATKSIVVGTTTTLTTTVRDANGVIVTNRLVTWSTSDPLVATVSSTGVVTAVAVGSATITATSEGKSGSSTITVTPVPVANVTVQPPTMALQVGQTATATAVTKDANGNVLTGRVITWISNNPSVATVSATGLVSAVAPGGPVFVTATSEGWNGSTAVTVTAVPVASVTLPATTTLVAGQSTTLVPVVKDANDLVVTDRVVTWTSSNPAVATVTSAGVVKSLITGSATITATSEGKSGATMLTVTPAAVGSVSLAPSTTTIASGSTGTLVPTVKDINGTTVTDRTVTWTSSDPLVATVSASGVVTALAAGTATITATSETMSGTATVTVIAGPAASITVTPAPGSLRAGQNLQLSATAKDSVGNTITGRSFTWTSSNTNVATVTSSGQVRSRTTGTTTITAAMDTKSGTSLVTVTP